MHRSRVATQVNSISVDEMNAPIWLKKWLLCSLAACHLACSGAVSKLGESIVGSGGTAPVAPEPSEKVCRGEAAPSSRVFRLTQQQYSNTVKELLSTQVDLSQEFLTDPSLTGYSTDSESLQVTDRHVRDYQRAAERFAADLSKDTVAFNAVVPCDIAQGEVCARQFIADFGLKALRRPVSTAETELYMGLYNNAAMLSPSGVDAKRSGVALVVEAMLQTPDFLYRLELDANDDPTATPLNDYELASRLSFMFLQSAPDRELLEAAKSGLLKNPDTVTQQSERLIALSAARANVLQFHHQWLRTDRTLNVKRSTTKFPLYTPALNLALKEETERLVKDVILEQRLGIAALLRADFAWVNDDTAPIYGLPKPGNVWSKSMLPDNRRGLLMQLGYLATNGYFDKNDIIHRGVFVHQKILCTELGAPGAAAMAVSEPPYSDTVRTRREQVAAHTAKPGCQECHQAINPAGFAFERFDAIGQIQTMDRGIAIDTSSMLSIDERQVEFQDAEGLTVALSSSPQVSACYATQWFRSAMGRKENSAEACEIATLARGANGQLPSFSKLAASLVRSEAFLRRGVRE